VERRLDASRDHLHAARDASRRGDGDEDLLRLEADAIRDMADDLGPGELLAFERGDRDGRVLAAADAREELLARTKRAEGARSHREEARDLHLLARVLRGKAGANGIVDAHDDAWCKRRGRRTLRRRGTRDARLPREDGRA